MGPQLPDTILVVDDHQAVRESLQELLRAEGYLVVTAADGREALAILYRGLRPCLIIMDLMMPVMNGFEFREQQLRHPDLSRIPFIAYSAVVDTKNTHHLNADAYFEKPTDPQQVLSVIRQFCAH
jgi:CheY-like chemotaxis protein